ncbi:MAG: hypothetical protein QXZ09_01165 [Candidatus Methanomethylicaceae archaeon]
MPWVTYVMGHWVPVGIGEVVRRSFPSGAWSSRNKSHPCSLFIIARTIIEIIPITFRKALTALRELFVKEAESWG